MLKMTLGKLFELYFDIFEKFGPHLLDETNEMIGYYVFEATDISIGYCSERILKCLLEEGIIDEPICEESAILLTKFRKLDGTVLWNVEAVKTSPEWKAVMEQADKIKIMIKTRWTDNEIQEIIRDEQRIDLKY